MINLFKICLPLFLFLFGINNYEIIKNGEIKHTIKIIHPGIHLTDPVERTLIQVQSPDGIPDEFYMDVETVVCGDKQCRIDEVRIFWNELGFFDHLVLPPGVELEKAEGKHFTKSDYEKLNNILTDKNSSLKEVYKEEVVGTETSEGVDAMTGATIILNKEAYVEGAVWTCYTLWHWANGGVYTIIRDMIGDELNVEELKDYLKTGKIDYKIFALEQIAKRKKYEPESVQIVVGHASIDNYEWQKLVIDYLEYAPADIYFSSTEQLLETGSEKQRLRYLNALLKTKKESPENYYEQLCQPIFELNSYQEINLFLNILENKKVMTPEVLNKIIALLDNENFLIARRAYWFLSEQELQEEAMEKIGIFGKKHRERL